MDSKKLFDLVLNICGSTKENPLPECSSDKKLADQFAEFFITKDFRLFKCAFNL